MTQAQKAIESAKADALNALEQQIADVTADIRAYQQDAGPWVIFDPSTEAVSVVRHSQSASCGAAEGQGMVGRGKRFFKMTKQQVVIDADGNRTWPIVNAVQDDCTVFAYSPDGHVYKLTASNSDMARMLVDEIQHFKATLCDGWEEVDMPSVM